MILTILVFLLVLMVLVLIHEAGHYFVAKWFGIKVEEFGFGFPPKAFGFKRGETLYTINWLPLGGFVKLFGEDEAGGGRVTLPVASSKYKVSSIGKNGIHNTKYLIPDTDVHRAFFARPVYQRFLVVVAGVVMNTLLAGVLFYIFLFNSGFVIDLPLITNHTFQFVHQTNYNTNKTDVVVSMIAPNSPAEKSGMVVPAKIIRADGKSVDTRDSFVDFVNSKKGQTVTLEWQELKSGLIRKASFVPRLSPPKNEGALGVGFFPVTILSYETQEEKLLSGFTHSWNVMSYSFDAMSKLVSISIKEKSTEAVSQGVSGPVGIVGVVGDILKTPTTKEQVLGILNLAGLLSVSLAFFNALPIPALDGGRLFFILIEAITGKKVNQKYEAMAHTIGMIVLLGLILLITIRDISKLIH